MSSTAVNFTIVKREDLPAHFGELDFPPAHFQAVNFPSWSRDDNAELGYRNVFDRLVLGGHGIIGDEDERIIREHLVQLTDPDLAACWLYTNRRLTVADGAQLVSCFHLDDGMWRQYWRYIDFIELLECDRFLRRK